jgi:hypothetical protein
MMYPLKFTHHIYEITYHATNLALKFLYIHVHYRVQAGSGAHPLSYPVGTESSFLGVKGYGHEAGHSPPSSAKFKNAWSYTSIPPYVFTAWCLVKHRIRLHGVYLVKPRDNFTSYTNGNR